MVVFIFFSYFHFCAPLRTRALLDYRAITAYTSRVLRASSLFDLGQRDVRSRSSSVASRISSSESTMRDLGSALVAKYPDTLHSTFPEWVLCVCFSELIPFPIRSRRQFNGYSITSLHILMLIRMFQFPLTTRTKAKQQSAFSLMFVHKRI